MLCPWPHRYYRCTEVVLTNLICGLIRHIYVSKEVDAQIPCMRAHAGMISTRPGRGRGHLTVVCILLSVLMMLTALDQVPPPSPRARTHAHTHTRTHTCTLARSNARSVGRSVSSRTACSIDVAVSAQPGKQHEI